MSCEVGEVTERLENELCSNPSVDLPTTLPLLHLRHSSFSNPSFASPTSQVLHLIHLVSRPCYEEINIKMDTVHNNHMKLL